MLLIEVFVPGGALSEEDRKVLGQRLIDTLMVEDDGHAIEIIDAQRTLTQVLVHEPAAWVLGQRPAADPADPPRYLVRVTVPASWRREMCDYTVEIITGVLAETERAAGRDPERMRREPHAVILVDGISEGGIGIHGRAMGSLDLTELVSRPYRDNATARPVPDSPQGGLIDPVCGMRVDLDDSTLTLVHDGVLYGFCHGLCRRAFADEHGVPLGR
ncbi:YHS domain protein [Streptomyces sp. TRM68367]|uniref:YHS domain protein n=1 Tax=Streptomyces sp. TRM68367 TaxID=2758415 RepID=UPI00165BD39C|nr:YHS domain protein [Streptomyces sp. TRM68367]MBC9725894.1 YHS domain protein [Streptomyces sp. TRM68367]